MGHVLTTDNFHESGISNFLITFIIVACGSRFEGEVAVEGRAASYDSQKNILYIRTDSIWIQIELKGVVNDNFEDQTRQCFLNIK